MGQKVNPVAIRLGITRDWVSKWYANKKQFPLQVHTDFRVRQFLKAKLADASVSRILIDRAAKRVNITIQTARPGIVIGKKGEDIEKLRAETAKMLKLPAGDVAEHVPIGTLGLPPAAHCAAARLPPMLSRVSVHGDAHAGSSSGSSGRTDAPISGHSSQPARARATCNR